MIDNSEMIAILLNSPDSQLDAAMKPYIRKWSKDPKAIEVLEVLDHCIHGSLASGFMVSFLQALYDMALIQENTTHEDVVKLATWRNK